MRASRRTYKSLRKINRHTKKRGGGEAPQYNAIVPAYANTTLELPFVGDLDESFMADDNELYDETGINLDSTIGEEYFMSNDNSNILSSDLDDIQLEPWNDEISAIEDENDSEVSGDVFVGGRRKNKHGKRRTRRTRKNKRKTNKKHKRSNRRIK
jgi:hypothetical protein